MLSDDELELCPFLSLSLSRKTNRHGSVVGLPSFFLLPGMHSCFSSSTVMVVVMVVVRWCGLFRRFVVVREPAERMVSAFLNKCVLDGYMR